MKKNNTFVFMKFTYYNRIVNNKVVELSVENGETIEYIGQYKGEEFCEFEPIDKEEFIKIGTLLNMFTAPVIPTPLFIQD